MAACIQQPDIHTLYWDGGLGGRFYTAVIGFAEPLSQLVTPKNTEFPNDTNQIQNLAQKLLRR